MAGSNAAQARYRFKLLEFSTVRKLYCAVEFISCDWKCPYRGRELVSDSMSAIEAPASMCYIDDHLPHAGLEQCSYWGCGQVFIHYIS